MPESVSRCIIKKIICHRTDDVGWEIEPGSVRLRPLPPSQPMQMKNLFDLFLVAYCIMLRELVLKEIGHRKQEDPNLPHVDEQQSFLHSVTGNIMFYRLQRATIWEGLFADEVLLVWNSASAAFPEQRIIVADVCTQASVQGHEMRFRIEQRVNSEWKVGGTNKCL